MGEPAEVYIVSKRTSRKEHKCCECFGLINKGEQYNVHHGIFDGDPFRSKVCLDCDVIRNAINKGRPFEESACLTEVADFVFEIEDFLVMQAFLKIKEKRGAPVQQWMNDRFDELANQRNNLDDSANSE